MAKDITIMANHHDIRSNTVCILLIQTSLREENLSVLVVLNEKKNKYSNQILSSATDDVFIPNNFYIFWWKMVFCSTISSIQHELHVEPTCAVEVRCKGKSRSISFLFHNCWIRKKTLLKLPLKIKRHSKSIKGPKKKFEIAGSR